MKTRSEELEDAISRTLQNNRAQAPKRVQTKAGCKDAKDFGVIKNARYSSSPAWFWNRGEREK